MSVTEMPWIKCPDIYLDLEIEVDRRFAQLPEPLFDRARTLLDDVLVHIPNEARLFADAANARTKKRFDAEVKALARVVDRDWRDIMLANISYDLTLPQTGYFSAGRGIIATLTR